MAESERRTAIHETGPQRQTDVPDGANPPALFAWLAAAVTVGLIIATQFLPRSDGRLLRAVGVCLLMLAGLLIFWSFCLLAKQGGRGSQALVRARCFVRRGPYAVIRHPQYLGYTLLSWGFALLSGHWVAYALGVASSAFFYLQALQEEAYCLPQFGATYDQYRQRVPRYNILWGIARLWRGGRS
jgi:protein-S-isoprenylcysteine O-methyltransferase Ste14